MINLSFAYIYIYAIYIFEAFILPFLYIMSFVYMCLGMLQAIVLQH